MSFWTVLSLFVFVTTDGWFFVAGVYTTPDDVITQRVSKYHFYPIKPRPCPCTEERLCQRIVEKPKYEVFVFTVNVSKSQWFHFDWTKVTTVVNFGSYNDELMCYAHSKGVRVLYPSAGIPPDQLLNATARTEWVNNAVEIITFNFLDGINLDYERSISAKRPDQRDALTQLVQELQLKLKSLFPQTLMTTDYPYRPNGGQRYYDYKAITDMLDFTFIMDYDEPPSAEFSPANCGYSASLQGLKDFMSLGITSDRIVMGFPWYGYYYQCHEIEKTSNHCIGRKTIGQITYKDIVGKYLPMSSSGRLWDAFTKSLYFNVKDPATGKLHQLWYDDPTSLSIKYQLTTGLRGVGMWHATALNYSDPTQVFQMWSVLPSFP